MYGLFQNRKIISGFVHEIAGNVENNKFEHEIVMCHDGIINTIFFLILTGYHELMLVSSHVWTSRSIYNKKCTNIVCQCAFASPLHTCARW